MSQKTTVVLLILCLLVVGFLLAVKLDWFGLGPEAEEDYTRRIGKPLLDNPPPNSKVTRVRLERPGEPTVSAERRGEQWFLDEPLSVRADYGEVDALVSAVKDLTVAAVYPAGDQDTPSDEIAGLDKPRARIVIEGTRIKKSEDKDKEEAEEDEHAGHDHGDDADDDDEEKESKPEEEFVSFELQVGGQDPISDRTFVRLAGDDKIYAVETDPMRRLNVQVSALRTRDFWDATSDSIDRLELDTDKGRLTLRKQDGQWRIAEPVAAPADQSAVSGLISNIVNMQAKRWIADKAENLSIYGLTQPVATATLRAAPASTQPDAERPAWTLQVGLKMKDEHYATAAGRPAVFTVSAEDVNRLAKGLGDLRSKKLANVSKEDVVSLQLAGEAFGGRRVKLLKDAAGRWQMLSPVEAEADGDAVSQWLDKLLAIEPDSFQDRPTPAARAAADDVRGTITLALSSGDEPVTITIGQASATGATSLLKNSAWPALAVVRAGDLDGVLADPMALAGKQILTLRADRVKRIARTGKEGGRAIERIADDWTKWQLTAPVKMAAGQEAAGKVVDKLTDLSAEQRTLLSPADAGLDKPELTVTLTVLQRPEGEPATQPDDRPDVEVERTVVLASKDGALYARVDNAGPVWQMPADLLDALSGEWADSALLPDDALPDGAARSITLHSSAGDFTLQHADETWKLASDPTFLVDESRVDTLLTAVREVAVQHYVDFSADDLAGFGLAEPATRVTVTLADDKKVDLLISEKGEAAGKYVTVAGSGRVGLLAPTDLAKFHPSRDEFQKTDE